jgi:beta-lactamase superfamily II metal-dependent hydrolase
MNCEVEFLPVGDGSKAGDAVVIRYGDASLYELMVIDGGNLDSGKLLVEHIRKYFRKDGKDPLISHVVLTHSDVDHASGLREVLRELRVENLWLHIPWLLAEEARHLFEDKRWTENGLRDAIRKEYDVISEIVDLGLEQKSNFFYPFQGSNIGPFRVLSPSRFAYVHLLPQFDKTPDPDQNLLETASMWIGKQPSGLMALLEKVAAKVQKWIPETWNSEKLKDGGVTSASNETSVVLYGAFDGNRRLLLTGDAGVNGLTWAANYADLSGLPLQFAFVQIPHHGSRRNVGPTVLDRILGPIQPENSATKFSAFVSAPAEDDMHPRKMVLNAFARRGGRVIATQGSNKVYWGGFPNRPGYIAANPLPFANQVEAYDS